VRRSAAATPRLALAVTTAAALGAMAMACVARPQPGAAHAAVAAAPARLADHVVLVSIDGLRPEMYLDASWPAPLLQQMAREGAHAGAVFGVFPSVTYPTHTTIVTGALPARHGIHYNTPFEPAGESGRWYWEASSIRVPTLWSAARAAGLTTAAVSWPVTVGAELDWNVPEIWPLEEEEGSIVAVQRRHDRPGGLVEELEREATGRLTDELWDLGEMVRDDRAGEMAAWLLERRRPALLLLHVLAVDHFQHEHGREHPLVRRALGAADRVLGRLVEAAQRAGIAPRTAFVVTGDHGFADVHTTLYVNAWLAAAGLRAARADRGDWRATFHTSSASAFLHLRDRRDAQAVERARAALAAQPPELRRLFRVVERDELDRLGAAPDAALGLAFVPGVTAGYAAERPPTGPSDGATHGYLPDTPGLQTGLVGWGPGFHPGAAVPRMQSVDVAPLVARLLGLPFTAPDGVLRGELLREAPATATAPSRSRSR
jgi:predicted AlkP superfamily pyrophosphatase or phosphodiesterase